MAGKQKPFYVVSGLKKDSSGLGNLNHFNTEAEAVERAKEVINIRASQGQHSMEFFILKVVAKVTPLSAPVKVEKYK